MTLNKIIRDFLDIIRGQLVTKLQLFQHKAKVWPYGFANESGGRLKGLEVIVWEN